MTNLQQLRNKTDFKTNFSAQIKLFGFYCRRRSLQKIKYLQAAVVVFTLHKRPEMSNIFLSSDILVKLKRFTRKTFIQLLIYAYVLLENLFLF